MFYRSSLLFSLINLCMKSLPYCLEALTDVDKLLLDKRRAERTTERAIFIFELDNILQQLTHRPVNYNIRVSSSTVPIM